MCLTFCHKREILYDSDTDVVCGVCPHNFPDGRDCDTCQYKTGEECGLTRAPLPARGWCCHHSLHGSTPYARGGVYLFGQQHLKGCLGQMPLQAVLECYGVEGSAEDDGVRVELTALATPIVYGMPTVHWIDEIAGCAQPQEPFLSESGEDFSVEL